MNLQTLMHAAPVKTNELFVRLLETADGAVKTREKLFTDLKTELELHIQLEEQHLFPVMRRNAETKDLVPDAVKDNKELRAKLAAIEALPKNDPAFPSRLKDLQKSFRQHARDEKRELLPAVQRALSEAQVQGVAEKMEAGVADAEQAKRDEQEERKVKVRREREQAEQAAHEAERTKAEAESARQQQEERQATLLAEQEDAVRRSREAASRQIDETAEIVARAASASRQNVVRMAETTAASTQRIANEVHGAAETVADRVKAVVPDPRGVASLPGVAAGAIREARVVWMDLMMQATRASQDILLQAAAQQQDFANGMAQRWMEHNARIMQITIHMAQESVRRVTARPNGD